MTTIFRATLYSDVSIPATSQFIRSACIRKRITRFISLQTFGVMSQFQYSANYKVAEHESLSTPCHLRLKFRVGSGRLYLRSLVTDLVRPRVGLIPELSKWDLLWKERNWNKVVSEKVAFPCQLLFHHCPTYIYLLCLWVGNEPFTGHTVL
jgi:hypothetical protein